MKSKYVKIVIIFSEMCCDKTTFRSVNPLQVSREPLEDSRTTDRKPLPYENFKSL